MCLLLPLGRNWNKYERLYGTKRPDLTLACENPKCDYQVLYKHGHYSRHPATKHRILNIPIWRWRCPICGQTVSVLPDFIIAWAHVVTPVREAAMERKIAGMGFSRVAQSILSIKVGGISSKTVKRWWRHYLNKVDEVSLWVAGELIKAGVNEDLLRIQFRGVNPTFKDTLLWFSILLRKYRFHISGRSSSPLMGYFCFLNAQLPAGMWI